MGRMNLVNKWTKLVVLGATSMALLAACGTSEEVEEVVNEPTSELVTVATNTLEENLEAIENGSRPEEWDPAKDNGKEGDIGAATLFASKYLPEMNADDLREGTHVVYIGRPTCIYCNLLIQTMEPVLQGLDVSMGQVNTDKLGNRSQNYIFEELGVMTVPQVLLMHEGKIIESIDYVIEDGSFIPAQVEDGEGNTFMMEQPLDEVPAYAATYEDLAKRIVDLHKSAQALKDGTYEPAEYTSANSESEEETTGESKEETTEETEKTTEDESDTTEDETEEN